MTIIAQIIGLVAVATFLLSYQQKKRKNIIAMNVLSRCLYILQYVLLGAFSGAALDILGALSAFIAVKKHVPFINKHQKLILAVITLSIVGVGISIAIANKSFLDLFSLAGVLIHTSAFWISNEKTIRRVSLIGSPFWFVYNLLSRAYGSAIGDALSMLSIVIAMIRHRDQAGEKEE